jgi:CheY-like chemotaxis protein
LAISQFISLAFYERKQITPIYAAMQYCWGACMARTRKKILCIEDDRDTAALIAEELVERGFEVSIAHNGQEGLLAILKEKPDLVLCDIGVPIMSGFEVLERLSEIPPPLKKHKARDCPTHRPAPRFWSSARRASGRWPDCESPFCAVAMPVEEQSRFIREAPQFTPQLGAKSSGGTTALPPAHTGSASLEHVWLATENLWRISHTRPESLQTWRVVPGRKKILANLCASFGARIPMRIA